ncbi:MAG: major capsid protein [Microvirus sp.]|nr:MAG: major capsid protein [Microvirus sp.]
MSIYEGVRANRPGRSAFNLSHEVKTTCDLGQLVPFLCEEVVPGDIFKIGVEAVLRFMPLVAPVLHEINIFMHYLFVPTRLMFPEPNGWESFITGGVAGTDATALPRWIPTGGNVTNANGSVVADNGLGSLWDYFGFPPVIPAGVYPLSFTRRGYNLIYNTFYKDETQIADVAIDSSIVLQRAWEKDYFTSALPWQQRGTAPGLPISGSTAAVWAAAQFSNPEQAQKLSVSASAGVPTIYATAGNSQANAMAAWNTNTVSLSPATTFNVSDLRLAFQIQKWQERNARGGARYIEFLKNHFSVAPRDERLQRPEYIGGTKFPIIVSEVLQTNASPKDGAQSWTSPQGTMAGHGISAGRDFVASYHAKEYGYIFGIMSVMPRTAYSQGIDRQFLRTTRYDYYHPEFAHLSEQAVYDGELLATANGGTAAGQNLHVWGYQGRYNEMRARMSRTTGLMRPGVAGSLSFWHLSRVLGAGQQLNQSMIECIPRKDWLAVPSQPACLINIANIVKAIRPMPVEADPGLIDH